MNISFKDFVRASKWVTHYENKSLFKRVIFYLLVPINYIKFKKEMK